MTLEPLLERARPVDDARLAVSEHPERGRHPAEQEHRRDRRLDQARDIHWSATPDIAAAVRAVVRSFNKVRAATRDAPAMKPSHLQPVEPAAPADADGVSLPAWIYRDAEFFERERDCVFRGSWQLVCHLSDVPQPGDFHTFEFLGESVLVLRGEDGAVRAFHNVCRHRAARLLDGPRGHCGRRITCPYHAWTYGSDGLHINVAHPGLTRLFGKGYGIESQPWIDKMSGALRDTPSGNWSERLYQRLLPEVPYLPPERQRLWTYFKLWPNVALDIYPDQVDFMQFLPVSATETVIREIAYVHPDARREMRVARYLNWRINRRVSLEDKALIERVQAGMASSSYSCGPLGEGEVCLRSFARRMRALIPESGLPRAPPRGWSHA